MDHEIAVLTQGDVRQLKEHRAVLAEAGIAAHIVRPPGAGKG